MEVLQGDITQIKVDAIVNAANTTLLGGGGVDGAIHRAAGPALLHACRELHGCDTGKAKVTKGYLLPARYIIHTPGPIWKGGDFNEGKLLSSCYQSCLVLADKFHCQTLAFPSISTGVYHFPLIQAVHIAVKTIIEYLQKESKLRKVFLICFDEKTWKAYKWEISGWLDQTE